jgi:hypothetical protein
MKSFAKQYGIRAFPQNLLYRPKGKIIAKNIRGYELEKKLKELIKPKLTFFSIAELFFQNNSLKDFDFSTNQRLENSASVADRS